MDHHLFLEILDGQRDLAQVVSAFQLCDALATLDEFVEGLVGAEFQDDVDIAAVLEGPFIFDHEFGSDRLVDFNF